MLTKSKFSASVFEDQRIELTDFAVVYDSPSIRAEPSVTFRFFVIVFFFFFENSKMVNRWARFCPGGPPSSVSHGSL